MIWLSIEKRIHDCLRAGMDVESASWKALADEEKWHLAEQLRSEMTVVDRKEIDRVRKAQERMRERARFKSLLEALDAAERMVGVARAACSSEKCIALERAIHQFRRAAERARPAKRKVA